MAEAEPVTEIVGGKPYRYYPLGEHIVRAPGVCGGRPTFKYTRIEIAGALERLAAGSGSRRSRGATRAGCPPKPSRRR